MILSIMKLQSLYSNGKKVCCSPRLSINFPRQTKFICKLSLLNEIFCAHQDIEPIVFEDRPTLGDQQGAHYESSSRHDPVH